MTWELADDLAARFGPVAMLTGHPDTLAKEAPRNLLVCPSIAYDRTSLLRRVWSWWRYTVHAFWWLWKWPATTPLVLFSNPPLLVWLGWCMRRLRATRYAVMVHDVYPDVVVRLGHVREKSFVARVWRWLNYKAYSHADLIMTLTPGMARAIEEQRPVTRRPAGKIHVVYPWADTERIKPRSKCDNPFARQFNPLDALTVMYAGNMGLGHDLETMLEAATVLRNDRRFHFMFVGSGPKWRVVQHAIQDRCLANATLLEWQPESRLPEILAAADVAVVSLESELAGLAIPSKTFYSLAAGTPLVVVCEQDSDLSQLVQDYQCGWHLQPGDVEGFVAILRRLRDDSDTLLASRQASRNAALQCGTRQVNSMAIARLLEQFLGIRCLATVEQPTRRPPSDLRDGEVASVAGGEHVGR